MVKTDSKHGLILLFCWWIIVLFILYPDFFGTATFAVSRTQTDVRVYPDFFYKKFGGWK